MAFFDSPLTLRSDSFHTSPGVLPDPENISITAGSPLLTSIRAEIYVVFYLYFRLITAIFDFQHAHTRTVYQLVFLCYLNIGYSRWNFVVLFYASAEICFWIFKTAILDYWLPLTYSLLTIIIITPVYCGLPSIEEGVPRPLLRIARCSLKTFSYNWQHKTHAFRVVVLQSIYNFLSLTHSLNKRELSLPSTCRHTPYISLCTRYTGLIHSPQRPRRSLTLCCK